MSITKQPRSARYIAKHVAASEVWVILPALLALFLAATRHYGQAMVLRFLAMPHLSTTILVGVGVWLVGMMIQGKWVAGDTDAPGKRQSSLWVPIKGALLTVLLLPIPGLTGSLITHLLSQWVRLIG